LKHKYEEPIFYDDMNFEMQEERYEDLIKEESKFSDALAALHENYCPAQINARDGEMKDIEEYISNGIASKGSSESLCTGPFTKIFQEFLGSEKLYA
jgi:hypothetical protein